MYELIIEKTTVGRGEQNTLVIHDTSLSNAHCEILLNGTEVIVRDLDSRNGTFVNGTRLQDHQAQLKHGQTVRFGAVEARLELDGESETEETTASEVTAIHAYNRAIRDQRRAEQHPKPANPSMELGTDADDGEKTVTHVRPPSIPPQPATTAPAPTAPKEIERKRSGAWMLFAVIGIALIAMIVWLLMR